MNEMENCTEYLIAAMAIADGERPSLPREVVEAHLAACPVCRTEIAGLAETSSLLDASRRASVDADVWPTLEPRIAAHLASMKRRNMWTPFVALAIALLVSRVLLAAAPDAAFAIKMVTLVLTVIAFVYARENPFTIRTELRLGQEQ